MRKKGFGSGLLEKLLRKLEKEDLREYALTLTHKEIMLVASALGAFFESTSPEKNRFTEDDIKVIICVLYKIKDETEKTKSIN